jgi:hypothetical protein
MANIDKAFGLRPIGNLSATGAQKQYGYQIADNQGGTIFQGDLVALSAGFITRFLPATHTAAVGVFNGCSYIDPTTGKPTFKNFYPGSIDVASGQVINADVLDDPNQLFLVQCDEGFVAADVGKNADVVGTGGSTTTGISTMELDSSTLATTAALNLKVVGLYNDVNNEFGTNAVVVVKINEHVYGSAGVAGQ